MMLRGQGGNDVIGVSMFLKLDLILRLLVLPRLSQVATGTAT